MRTNTDKNGNRTGGTCKCGLWAGIRGWALVILLALAWPPCGCADEGKETRSNGSDAAPAQTAPEPAPEGTGGWKDLVIGLAGQITLAAEDGILFYAYDTLAWPDQPVELLARATRLKEMKGIAGATVTFTLDGKPLGSVKTDESGRAKMNWTPPREGSFIVEVRLAALPDGTAPDVKPSSLMVLARAKDARFIVVDLDHTVVDSGFAHVLMGMARPMPGAAEALRALQKGGYNLIYLTHRPDLMTVKSKNWLTNNEFPRAPLLVSTLEEAIGDSGKFKTGRIKTLREKFPNLAVGIGDKFTDAEAYAANGMTAYVIPHYKRKGDKAKDFEKVAEQVNALSGTIQVVDSWEEVKAGLGEGKQFPPKPYAERLKARAERLRREERERKRRNDDDND